MKVSRIIIHRCFSPTKAGHNKVKTFVIVIIVAAISLHTNTPDNGVNDVILNKHASCDVFKVVFVIREGGVKLYVWATYHKFFISKYHREIACHVINVDLCVVALNIKKNFSHCLQNA